MNPFFYITAFAWIAIIALSLSIFSTYWIPMVIGAVLFTLLMRIALPSR